MNDWEEIERVLLARGIDTESLERLRRGLKVINVSSNHGVVADSISGPIAIGAGAVASTGGALRGAESDVARPSSSAGEGHQTHKEDKVGATQFWKKASELATSATSATVAASKILELATKFL